MKNIIYSLIFLLSSLCSAQEITYSPPSEFNILPIDIINDLTKNNCQIPTPNNYKFGGIIIGELAAKNQIDLAVICVTQTSKKILIYWGGPTQCPSSITSSGQHIQAIDEHIVYNYLLVENSNPPSPKMGHLAIDDSYLGKGSTTSYCKNGKWVYLGGAD